MVLARQTAPSTARRAASVRTTDVRHHSSKGPVLLRVLLAPTGLPSLILGPLPVCCLYGYGTIRHVAVPVFIDAGRIPVTNPTPNFSWHVINVDLRQISRKKCGRLSLAHTLGETSVLPWRLVVGGP
jgi:hypothetical protein